MVSRYRIENIASAQVIEKGIWSVFGRQWLIQPNIGEEPRDRISDARVLSN